MKRKINNQNIEIKKSGIFAAITVTDNDGRVQMFAIDLKLMIDFIKDLELKSLKGNK